MKNTLSISHNLLLICLFFLMKYIFYFLGSSVFFFFLLLFTISVINPYEKRFLNSCSSRHRVFIKRSVGTVWRCSRKWFGTNSYSLLEAAILCSEIRITDHCNYENGFYIVSTVQYLPECIDRYSSSLVFKQHDTSSLSRMLPLKPTACHWEANCDVKFCNGLIVEDYFLAAFICDY